MTDLKQACKLLKELEPAIGKWRWTIIAKKHDSKQKKNFLVTKFKIQYLILIVWIEQYQKEKQ
jgi:hypothetical protein